MASKLENSHRVLICSTCDPRGQDADAFAGALESALADAGLDCFTIDRWPCMGACAEPMALALQGKARASYLFSGLEPARDIADIVATCRAYLDHSDGWIEDARACGRLRHCLRARLPALPE